MDKIPLGNYKLKNVKCGVKQSEEVAIGSVPGFGATFDNLVNTADACCKKLSSLHWY